MAGGRPSKLTEELCDKICKEIRDGIPPATAAQLHGIHRSTYERWLKRGREAKRKTQYREFCDKIKAAKSFAEKKHLHRIMESKDWKAQKYLLTLLNKEYALPDKIQVKADVKNEVEGEVKINEHTYIPKDPKLRGELANLLLRIRTEEDKSIEPGKD